MRKIGRKRKALLDRAISKLVDAALTGEELYVADMANKSRVIGIRRAPWVTKRDLIARWRTDKTRPAAIIDYEEADRLIRKHLGYGE